MKSEKEDLSSSGEFSKFWKELAAGSEEKPTFAERYDSLRADSDISCLAFYEEGFHCSGVLNQVRNYYRFGKTYDCADVNARFWACLRLKMRRDREQAFKEYRQLQKDLERPRHPPESHVWTFRSNYTADSRDDSAANSDNARTGSHTANSGSSIS
eukprot:Rmarinus@m.4349